MFFFFFSSRRRHTRSLRDWSSDVCSSDLGALPPAVVAQFLDALTGPTAAERLVAELKESSELPDVVSALEQDEHERALELLSEEISAADGERRERLLALTVALFGDLGHEHPLTVRYRRQLAATLY